MTQIEAGWYPDPAAPHTQRYWDGEQWVGKAVGIDQTPPHEPEPLPVEPEPEPTQSQSPQPEVQPLGMALLKARPSAEQLDKLLAGHTLAHPGLRLVARLIDVISVAALTLVANGWFMYQYVKEISPTIRHAMANPNADTSQIEFSDRAYELQVLILLISILVWFGYEVPATVSRGQTLGKRALGIKVVPIYAEKLRYGTVMSRWSLLMLPLACFPLGMILAIVDNVWCLRDRPFRQCLHDKSPGTMVVVSSNDPEKLT